MVVGEPGTTPMYFPAVGPALLFYSRYVLSGNYLIDIVPGILNPTAQMVSLLTCPEGELRA